MLSLEVSAVILAMMNPMSLTRGYFAPLLEVQSWKRLVYFVSTWALLAVAGIGTQALLAANSQLDLETNSRRLAFLLPPTPQLFFLVLGGVALIPVLIWVMLRLADVERWRLRVFLDARLDASPRVRHAGFSAWWRDEALTLGTFRIFAYFVLHSAFAAATLIVLGAMMYLTALLLTAPIFTAWGLGSSPNFSYWRDSILWTGAQGLKFTASSVCVALLAAMPMLVLTLTISNALANLWVIGAQNAFSGDAGTQRVLNALETSANSVLSDDTAAALATILREGVNASNARGARVRQFSSQPSITHALELNEVQFLDTLPANAQDSSEPLLESVGDRQILRVALQDNTNPGAELSALYGKERIAGRDLKLWKALGTQASTALRLQDLLHRERARGGEAERQRIARDLHDSVAQALYGIALGTRSAREHLERDPDSAKRALEYAIDLADGGTAEMKTLLFALRPDALEEGGLSAALVKLGEMLYARYKLEAHVNAEAELELSLETKGALYRIAQEAAHNVVKHARAKRVWITLEPGLLEVRDDGRGFDPTLPQAGTLGLKSMKERAEGMGATLEVTAVLGNGSKVCVTWNGGRA